MADPGLVLSPLPAVDEQQGPHQGVLGVCSDIT